MQPSGFDSICVRNFDVAHRGAVALISMLTNVHCLKYLDTNHAVERSTRFRSNALGNMRIFGM